MKNSFCHLNEVTVPFHPRPIWLTARLVCIVTWVPVADPNAWLAPPNSSLVLEFIRHCELKLTTHPVLVSWKEPKSSTDVVEDGIFGGL